MVFEMTLIEKSIFLKLIITLYAIFGNFQDLDFEHIPLFDHIGHFSNPSVGQLTDVNQSISAGNDLNESTEIGGFDHLAFIDRSNLDIGGQLFDPPTALLTGGLDAVEQELRVEGDLHRLALVGDLDVVLDLREIPEETVT